MGLAGCERLLRRESKQNINKIFFQGKIILLELAMEFRKSLAFPVNSLSVKTISEHASLVLISSFGILILSSGGFSVKRFFLISLNFRIIMT